MSATAADVLASLEEFIREEESRNGGPERAARPGHRKQFIWPRQSVAAQYNVKPHDFSRAIRFEIHGEAFPVLVADTPFGVFGRCEALWAEAKGSTEAQMAADLTQELEPLFARQFAISRTLGLQRRYDGAISDLGPTQLIRLLYCSDRDVAHAAMLEIDSHAGSKIYGPSLTRILEDESHPNRRIAQWCALDILEDLPNVCDGKEEELKLLAAIENLMMRAPDDYARAVYKAGDVLGDHIADEAAGEVLLSVLEEGPQPYGRRGAIHGLIHLCEWLPQVRDRAVAALQRAARADPEPLLRQYAKATIGDIVDGVPHGPEPVLPDEAAEG